MTYAMGRGNLCKGGLAAPVSIGTISCPLPFSFKSEFTCGVGSSIVLISGGSWFGRSRICHRQVSSQRPLSARRSLHKCFFGPHEQAFILYYGIIIIIVIIILIIEKMSSKTPWGALLYPWSKWAGALRHCLQSHQLVGPEAGGGAFATSWQGPAVRRSNAYLYLILLSHVVSCCILFICLKSQPKWRGWLG